MAAVKLLIKTKVASKILVVAPLRVCHSTWPGEIERWSDFSHLKIIVLHGPKKDQLLKQPADIYVINPEGLDWLLGTTKVALPNGKKKIAVNIVAFKKLGFDTLVIDELTKFKNHSADRF